MPDGARKAITIILSILIVFGTMCGVTLLSLSYTVANPKYVIDKTRSDDVLRMFDGVYEDVCTDTVVTIYKLDTSTLFDGDFSKEFLDEAIDKFMNGTNPNEEFYANFYDSKVTKTLSEETDFFEKRSEQEFEIERQYFIYSFTNTINRIPYSKDVIEANNLPINSIYDISSKLQLIGFVFIGISLLFVAVIMGINTKRFAAARTSIMDLFIGSLLATFILLGTKSFAISAATQTYDQVSFSLMQVFLRLAIELFDQTIFISLVINVVLIVVLTVIFIAFFIANSVIKSKAKNSFE